MNRRRDRSAGLDRRTIRRRAVLLATVGLLLGGCGGPEALVTVPAPAGLADQSPALQAEQARRVRAVQQQPEAAEAWWHLAQLYHANRYHAEAEAIYADLAARGASAEPGRLSYHRADLARERGDLPAAEAHLRRSLAEAEAPYWPARYALGEVLYKRGAAEEARAEFAAVLAAEPDHAHAALQVARDQLRRGEIAAGRQTLERLVARHPSFTEGLFLLAQLLERAGEPEHAAQRRGQAAAGWDLPPADPWLEALRAHCYDPLQLSLWFEDLSRVGRASAGLPYLERIEAIAPTSPAPHLLRGGFFAQSGRWAEADEQFRLASGKQADPTVLYPQWIAVLLELGRVDEAAKLGQAALHLAPHSALLHVAVGGVQLRQQAPEAAIATWRKAVQLDPHSVTAHQLLARVFETRNDLPAAVPHWQALAQIEPTNATVRRQLAQYHLDHRQWREALSRLRELHQLDPADAAVGTVLTRVLLDQARAAQARGDSAAALAEVEAALEVTPEDDEALRLRVPLLVDQGNFVAAEAAVLALVARHPGDARLGVALGNIQRAGGRPRQAVQTWQQALGQLPNHPESAALRAVLEDLIRQTSGSR